MTIPFSTEVQKLEQGAIVTMFEIDASRVGEGTLRFSDTSVDGAPITFGGLEYMPIPIKATGFAWTGSGTMPRPSLTIAAVNLAFLSMVIQADDLVGCKVTRIRTYRRFLDDGESPDPLSHFAPDEYVVERKVSQKRTLLQFELSALMDQQGLLIPARQVLRDSCSHSYRRWNEDHWDYTGVTCPYAGVPMLTPDGSTTLDPTKSACGKRLKDCKLHFGEHSVLPFYGFPGVGRL